MVYGKFNARRRLQLLNDVEKNRERADYFENELKLSLTAPDHVVEWSIEYGISIECFKCHDHNDWFVELDSLFPYDWASCRCATCAVEHYQASKPTK